MKIGILNAGDTPSELKGDYPSFAKMMEQLFLAHLPDTEFEHFNVKDGHFPQDVEAMNAWVITGSVRSANEELTWMLQLEELVRRILVRKIRLVGICFGHQIIAKALGGQVEKYSGGWGVGLHEYQWTEGNQPAIKVPAFHQDQVTLAPDGAKTVLTSSFCQHAAFIYQDTIFTCQFHPEFTIEFEQALLSLYEGYLVPDRVATQAKQSLLHAEADNSRIGHWIGQFLTR